jgi:hypothetical protein
MPESSLQERILDAFPSGNYGLLALLRVLDIVETTDVDTAAVECTELPSLRINPVFVQQKAETAERLLMLVMHELHHVLLGHTRLFPRLTALDNLIFDAVINALLCRMFPQPEYTSFFTRLYRHDRFPECLLRPAEGWTPAGPVPIPPALAARGKARVRHVYRALYSETGANYQELYDALRSVAGGATGGVPLSGSLESGCPGDAVEPVNAQVFEAVVDGEAVAVPLLGNHGEEFEPLAGQVFDAVRSIVEHWPQPPTPLAGRSWSELLDMTRVAPRFSSNRGALRTLLRKVAGPGSGGPRNLTSRDAVVVASPIPARDRRAIVLRALGVPQLLYPQETSMIRRGTCERVHVYVDVSGSIGPLKGALYGAVLDCQEIVHPTVHLFSTVVRDVSLTQLRQGRCRTTGGTSIECVARHMARHSVRRAVLLTDGSVGSPGLTASRTLSGATLGVALTPHWNLRTDLEAFVRFWAQLE